MIPAVWTYPIETRLIILYYYYRGRLKRRYTSLTISEQQICIQQNKFIVDILNNIRV